MFRWDFFKTKLFLEKTINLYTIVKWVLIFVHVIFIKTVIS